MNREEAYEVMKRGGYITHPILIDANAGPLYVEGKSIYGKNSEQIDTDWKMEISDQCFNTGWIECDAEGNPLKT